MSESEQELGFLITGILNANLDWICNSCLEYETGSQAKVVDQIVTNLNVTTDLEKEFGLCSQCQTRGSVSRLHV